MDVATTIRNNISKSNPYFIPKERYLELKHFCLQYPYWQKRYTDLDPRYSSSYICPDKNRSHADPTADMAIERDKYQRKICMVQSSAIEAGDDLFPYLIMSVTEGKSFANLLTYHRIPCCRDTFYDKYRKFFYILDKKRD